MRPSAIPFPLAVLVSLVVFLTPASGVPSAPPGTDKVVHVGVFVLLTVTGLLMVAGARSPRPAPDRRDASPTHRGRGPRRLLLLGLLCYAFVAEVLQGLLPLGRSADWADALANLAGIALGAGVFLLFGPRRPAGGDLAAAHPAEDGAGADRA
ncbi:VanZ family protein [Actinoalloteichus caeruleus]|uniref:VanZ family protein n=1 Tax=Actinoalloteichus cyanogriseus TaxID=2893586 RepID=UPI000403DB43|nr:VanZ family protein [Actinoalloteichus caeruleus]